jgi:hypothetical protein
MFPSVSQSINEKVYHSKNTIQLSLQLSTPFGSPGSRNPLLSPSK